MKPFELKILAIVLLSAITLGAFPTAEASNDSENRMVTVRLQIGWNHHAEDAEALARVAAVQLYEQEYGTRPDEVWGRANCWTIRGCAATIHAR